MFGIPVWAGWLIGATVLAAGSFYGGIKVEADYRDAQALKEAQQQLATFKAETIALNLVSQDLETKLENLNAFYSPIFVQVESVVKSDPIYARDCFDPAGLQLANRAIAGASSDSGKPHPAVSVTIGPPRRVGSDGAP